MISRSFSVFVALVPLVFTMAVSAQLSAPSAMALNPESSKIAQTVQDMLSAAQRADVEAFDKVTEPGTIFLEGGKKMSRDAIFSLVTAHPPSGMTMQWSVTEPDVHVSGNTAWISYVDKGLLTGDVTVKHMTWLESAVLEKAGVRWRIVLFHSSLVAEKDLIRDDSSAK
jgi:ketosteroid isomerase-like protein